MCVCVCVCVCVCMHYVCVCVHACVHACVCVSPFCYLWHDVLPVSLLNLAMASAVGVLKGVNDGGNLVRFDWARSWSRISFIVSFVKALHFLTWHLVQCDNYQHMFLISGSSHY